MSLLRTVIAKKVIGDDTPRPTPTGTISITENGTYDVREFAEAEVEVEGNDVIQMRGSYYLSDFTGLNLNKIRIKNYSEDANLGGGIQYSELGSAFNIFISGKPFQCSGIFGFGASTGEAAVKSIIPEDDEVKFCMAVNFIFRNAKYLEEIMVPTYTSAQTSGGNCFQNCNVLKAINFIRNGCDMPLALGQSSALTDDGLVLLANGLKEGSAKTVTLHATPKARCDTIMGTVAEETVDGTTYHVFTPSASGTVTLTNFITQTKGWTLA